MSRFLPRTVIILGLVSFLNDTASEMITPLLPLFLTATLGAGPAIVGLVEGLAEATASILKLVSSRLADRGWNSRKLVVGGYTVSNTARPLIGFALGWGWVLALRFLDRVGKGIRTAPRDALIASSTDEHVRGRAFGFQRALDHGGAMLGPLLAFGLLQWGMDNGTCVHGFGHSGGRAYFTAGVRSQDAPQHQDGTSSCTTALEEPRCPSQGAGAGLGWSGAGNDT